MLRMARQRRTPAALLACRARSLALRDASVDAVVSVSTFHYWRDPAAALREVARILTPGGRLVLTDWCGDYRATRLAAVWLRLSGRPFSRLYRARECVDLVESAGLQVQQVRRYRANLAWGVMTVVADRSRDR